MKRLIVPMAIILVCAAGFWLCEHSWTAYGRYRESRGMRQAAQCLAKGDLPGASVSARQVLQLNPRNAGACRILADLAEHSRSPVALDWIQRLAELEPTPENKLRLAAFGLRTEHSPYPLTRRTLEGLEPALSGTPAFQVLSAELALRSNRFSDARAHFERAAILQPLNPLHKLNLAALDIQSEDRLVAEAARESLQKLTTHTNLGPLALRWLVADDLRRNDLAAAEAASGRLIAHGSAPLEDRLQYLAVLQRMSGSGGNTEFATFLRDIQASAATNVVELFTVCEWMGNHQLADQGLVWVHSLKPESLKVQPIPLAIANLYLSKGDWAALEDFLAEQKWSELEFLRMALLSRAAGERHQALVETTRWNAALQLAAQRLGPLNLLWELAQQWNQDTEKVLWRIAQAFPKEGWVLDELEKLYAASGNTRGLNQVSGERFRLSKGDSDSANANNFATTSMLLGINLPRAHQIARALYDRQRANPVFASTYAYSLHLQGRTAEGLAVLRPFEPELSNAPAIAFYYGVLLAAAGDATANRYLAFADPAKLLPEERQLLTVARARCSEL